jgi:predicted aspartyl protease
LIDTGAAISILNKEFIDFINDDFKEIDYTTIQYGGNKVKLPVYEMIITLNGHDIPIRTAFDRNLELPSLLGQFGFLNEFKHVVFNYRLSISKLIKYS